MRLCLIIFLAFSFSLNLLAGDFLQQKIILEQQLEAAKLAQKKTIQECTTIAVASFWPPCALEPYEEERTRNELKRREENAQRKVDLLEQQLQSIAAQVLVSAENTMPLSQPEPEPKVLTPHRGRLAPAIPLPKTTEISAHFLFPWKALGLATFIGCMCIRAIAQNSP